MSRSCAVAGARASTARPAGVSAISTRRPSVLARVRATNPLCTRRLTTTETELWWVSVRSASSLSDSAGAPARRWSTKSCAAPRPIERSLSREDSRSARTIRRMASSTARVAGSRSAPRALGPEDGVSKLVPI
jgi:hypothetical protein